jgi:hypothetical protein
MVRTFCDRLFLVILSYVSHPLASLVWLWLRPPDYSGVSPLVLGSGQSFLYSTHLWQRPREPQNLSESSSDYKLPQTTPALSPCIILNAPTTPIDRKLVHSSIDGWRSVYIATATRSSVQTPLDREGIASEPSSVVGSEEGQRVHDLCTL